MKPMKVMRYRGSYRYKAQRRKRILTVVLALSIALVVVGAAVFGAIKLIPLLTAPRGESEPVQEAFLHQDEIAQLTLKAGEAYMLTIPQGVDMRGVTFTADDEKVVRVDSAGRIDALSEGTAHITAAAENFSAVCELTVEKGKEKKEPAEVTTALFANIPTLKQNRENGRDDLYQIIVNRRTNTVTVYTYDENGEYTVPVRAMICSCGTGGADITPVGKYAIYFTEKWHGLYGDVYGMYVSGFDGPYLFHSVPYYTKDHGDLETAEFNKLGTNASQGCVRMMASDVRWICKSCPLNTPVTVIDADASADPLGTPPAVKIDESIKWDPTDPYEKNPYYGKRPEISGTDDVTLKAGESFDPLADVTAADICGNDITDRMTVVGQVISDKPGTYYLTYSVIDDFSLSTEITRTVTVSQ